MNKRSRSFVVIVALACVCLGPLLKAGHWYWRLRSEATALRTIRGGNLNESHLVPTLILETAPDSLSSFLFDAGKLPRDLELSYAREDFSDLDISPVSQLTLLESVSLVRTRVTDEGLSALSGLVHLKKLELKEMPLISNAGIKKLPPMAFLETLDLSYTPVTSQGVGCLRGLRRLREISLVGTDVDDSIVDALIKCPQLEAIDLSDTTIRGTTLGRLSALTALRVLFLAGSDIRDEAIDQIVKVKQLQEINIECTRVGYSSLRELRQLPRLRIVRIMRDFEGAVSLSELHALENEMPGVTFVY